MLKNIIMTNDQEGEKSNLNSEEEPQINRGFELMLRQNNQEEFNSKKFQITFGKIISLLKREIHIYFEFSFDIKKN
jgi:hypothetical protein